MSTVISAEIPDSLERQLTEQQEPDESRSAAIRRTLRDGTEAPELRRENRELHEKLDDRNEKIEELRQELDERRDHAERTIALTKPAAVTLIGWFMIGLAIDTDPTELMVGLGALFILIPTVYSLIKRQQSGN